MELDNINRETETLDDLQNGYYIIQQKEGFRFGIDAVLLADFAKSASGRVIDLCSGNGIIPLLLAAKTDLPHIDAVEIQELMVRTARRSVRLNNLKDRIHIECADLKEAPSLYGKGIFDAVTVNPPYIKAGSGIASDGDMKLVARHEVMCSLDDVVSAASQLLKPQGKLFMVHRPQRLADIFCTMRKYRLEPKLMRLVCPKQGKPANMVLIYGIKDAKSELKLLPELYVYDNDGRYSKEIDVIYGR